jgi:hypothetical protein
MLPIIAGETFRLVAIDWSNGCAEYTLATASAQVNENSIVIPELSAVTLVDAVFVPSLRHVLALPAIRCLYSGFFLKLGCL